jgi:hypothetical protein
MPRGQGTRCWGFISEDLQWVHCTRPEYAGQLDLSSSSGTYAHKLYGACRCGVMHRPETPKYKDVQNGRKPQNQAVIQHEIRDTDGSLVAVHVRHGTGSGKKVWWEQPNGSKGLAGLAAEDLPLYGAEHLSDLPDGAEVVVTEGEPAAAALRSKGIAAVGTVTGANNTPSSAAFMPLVRLSPVMWPDADEPGAQHMTRNAALLASLGCGYLRLLDWQGAPNKCDAVDAIELGVDVLGLIAEAQIWKPAGVDLSALLDNLVRFLHQYVVITRQQAWTLALWIAHTHAFQAADCTPYISIKSAEKQSGKTLLLEVLSLLVARPWMTGRVTAAVLVRKVDRDMPTLLLDETDAAFGGDKEYSETLRGVLNSGYRKGGVVSLCVKSGNDFDLRDFPVFCPKALAGIGKLPDTVQDRSIAIELRRKARHEHVNRFRRRDVECESIAVRDQLQAWATVAVMVLEKARPTIPLELGDRAADVWEPLLAISDLAGGVWQQRAREAAMALSGTGVREDDSLGVLLLKDIRNVFGLRKVSRLRSQVLVESLLDLEESPWGDYGRNKRLDIRSLANMLSPYDVRPKQIRFDPMTTSKGYQEIDFKDCWERYIPPESETSETRETDSESKHDSQDQNVSDVSPVSVTTAIPESSAEASEVMEWTR